VRGGDQAYIGRDRLVAAHRPDQIVLQHAQQLHLQAHRHVADLAEQQRAALGALEQTAMFAGGTAECSLDVAE